MSLPQIAPAGITKKEACSSTPAPPELYEKRGGKKSYPRIATNSRESCGNEERGPLQGREGRKGGRRGDAGPIPDKELPHRDDALLVDLARQASCGWQRWRRRAKRPTGAFTPGS
jgi:hypothetical protein